MIRGVEVSVGASSMNLRLVSHLVGLPIQSGRDGDARYGLRRGSNGDSGVADRAARTQRFELADGSSDVYHSWEPVVAASQSGKTNPSITVSDVSSPSWIAGATFSAIHGLRLR